LDRLLPTLHVEGPAESATVRDGDAEADDAGPDDPQVGERELEPVG
jgi:hypothetical protein